MRHLRGLTFDDLPVGATFWFTAKTRTTRGATFRREPDRAYVKVSERRYRDVDDPEGRFLYAETRLDTGVTTSPPSENRARGRTSRSFVDLGEGIRVAFLPVNQAWAVMWHDQVLRVLPSRDEALAEGRRIVARDDPRRPGDAPDRAGAPPISRERYEEIVGRERAYEAAREQFDPRRFKRGGGYAPEEVAQIERLAGAPAPTNEERGLADQYRWLVDVPEHAFLYYDPAMTQVTGFMGDARGRIVWKGAVQRKFGGGRSQAIRVEGTNGASYHGVANLTGGNYVRLRLVKAEARALKKLEKFIP